MPPPSLDDFSNFQQSSLCKSSLGAFGDELESIKAQAKEMEPLACVACGPKQLPSVLSARRPAF